MATVSHKTKTEIALHALRERIQSGELAPGRRLQLNALTTELAMSPTPIREALRLLQADGLVVYRPHQGIVVAESSPEQIEEILRLRGVLEPLATELAVARLDPADLQRLEQVHERLLRAVEAGQGTTTSKTNNEWHWELYAAAGSPLLLELIRRLWEAYPWRTMWAIPGRAEQSAREHEAVMAAIRKRDASRTAARLRAHIFSGQKSLMRRIAPGEAP